MEHQHPELRQRDQQEGEPPGDAAHHREGNEPHELGPEQDQPMLGVPPYFRVLLFHEERDDGQQPQVRQHHHQTPVR